MEQRPARGKSEDGKPSRPSWAVRIAKQRKRTKMSQSDLAAAIGASQSTIASYETGQNEPGIGAFTRLAEAMKCSPAFLVFGDSHEDSPMQRAIMSLPDQEIFLLCEVIGRFCVEGGKREILDALTRLKYRISGGPGTHDFSRYLLLDCIDRVFQNSRLTLEADGPKLAAERAIARELDQIANDNMIKEAAARLSK